MPNTITYKTILAEAVRGYNKIQNALSRLEDVTEISPVVLSTYDSKTVSNNVTANQMVTAIEKLTEESTCTVETGELESGETYISGKNMVLSTDDTSGIEVSSYGSVSLTNVKQIHTAGYTRAGETILPVNTSAESILTKKYLTGLDIIEGKRFENIGNAGIIVKIRNNGGTIQKIENNILNSTKGNITIDNAGILDIKCSETAEYDIKDESNGSLLDIFDATITNLENQLDNIGIPSDVADIMTVQAELINEINRLV